MTDAEIVTAFLDASMKPDPDTAALYLAPDIQIGFTGRKFTSPHEASAFNARRYKWVKKQYEKMDVVEKDDHTVVYSLGTLYGEWPDGTPFEGNRYIDRFEVRNGKITRMDVWNESAERILGL
ncbi:nuclear transport factor 2 family protein [Roseibium aggregatum]|uniref:Nuclear transport factor 2 family protein n=1 Tax=Roseibium aggregatum TaxID=187304 RepID=A0A926SAA2_9HYPH|nr:nuclear transport factor 2 family protein [Roseibium aggregatum]MBD1548619.1 nuclear transport factor 2 family protein [Roseibium aggregatum]